jgi:hypothetical protein
MSLLPLTGLIKRGLSLFTVPGGVLVNDVLYETVDGQDQQFPRGTRTIEAAVDASDKQSLEFIFGASVADGDIGIYPLNDELYFLDLYGPDDVRMQSFVTYQGTQYRVRARAPHVPQAGINVYLASRHVTQDQI